MPPALPGEDSPLWCPVSEEDRVGAWWARNGQKKDWTDFPDLEWTCGDLGLSRTWRVWMAGVCLWRCKCPLKGEIQSGECSTGEKWSLLLGWRGTVLHLTLKPLLKGLFSLIPPITEGSYENMKRCWDKAHTSLCDQVKKSTSIS